jgi:hypothetical protein
MPACPARTSAIRPRVSSQPEYGSLARLKDLGELSDRHPAGIAGARTPLSARHKGEAGKPASTSSRRAPRAAAASRAGVHLKQATPTVHNGEE